MTFRGLCGSGAVREYFGKTDEVDIGKAFDEEDLAEKGDVGGEFAYTPVAGGPFSALLPSLWPQSILQDLTENGVAANGTAYNEFGFVKDAADVNPRTFTENSQQKMQWLAHLEFSASNKGKTDMTWDKVQYKISHTEKLRSMILEGIPHSLRPQMWMRLSGAIEKKFGSEVGYTEIVRNSIKIQKSDEKSIDKVLRR